MSLNHSFSLIHHFQSDLLSLKRYSKVPHNLLLFISYLPLSVYVLGTFPIMISLNPIHFVYFSGDTMLDLATTFVTLNQLFLLEILFQDTTSSWFSLFINNHSLRVASTFSHKFVNMWQFSVFEPFL